MDKPKTKERIEYETSLKTLHELSLKAALSEEGIDTSLIPRKKFDDIKRLLDKQGSARQKHQELINKLQQDAQVAIARAQQDMQAELGLIQTGIEQVVVGIKTDQGIIPVVQQPQEIPVVVKLHPDELANLDRMANAQGIDREQFIRRILVEKPPLPQGQAKPPEAESQEDKPAESKTGEKDD